MRITHRHLPIKPEGYTLEECKEFFPTLHQIDFTVILKEWNNADDTSGQYEENEYKFVATPIGYKTADGEHFFPLAADHPGANVYYSILEELDLIYEESIIQLSTSWEDFNIEEVIWKI